MVHKVQLMGDEGMAFRTLRHIRNVYVDLHQGTDSTPTLFSASTGDYDFILRKPHAYPLCKNPDHHLYLTPHRPHIHDSFPHAVLHDKTVVVPAAPASTPSVPSSSVLATLHAEENRTYLPLTGNHSTPASSHPTRRTAMGTRDFLPPPSDPATATGLTRDVKTSTKTISTAKPSTSISTSSVPPAGVLSFRNTADSLAYYDVPEIPSSTPAKPVFDDNTESHSSVSGATSSSTSPSPISTPALGTVKGRPKASSHKAKDALYPSSLGRAVQGNSMAIVDLPPHDDPPLASTTVSKIAVAGPLRRKPGTVNIGAPPPQTSHKYGNTIRKPSVH
ncbi:hypothetical protein EI94DRAFT_62080 [Lactarius quietus]|nr:hypothetical protein EI94DRAFT_62080 [Lactarius quietus]